MAVQRPSPQGHHESTSTVLFILEGLDIQVDNSQAACNRLTHPLAAPAQDNQNLGTGLQPP